MKKSMQIVREVKGLDIQKLRYMVKAGLIEPVSGGDGEAMVFSDDTINDVRFIMALQSAGYTASPIKDLMKNRDSIDWGEKLDEILQKIEDERAAYLEKTDDLIRFLKEMRLLGTNLDIMTKAGFASYGDLVTYRQMLAEEHPEDKWMFQGIGEKTQEDFDERVIKGFNAIFKTMAKYMKAGIPSDDERSIRALADFFEIDSNGAELAPQEWSYVVSMFSMLDGSLRKHMVKAYGEKTIEYMDQVKTAYGSQITDAGFDVLQELYWKTSKISDAAVKSAVTQIITGLACMMIPEPSTIFAYLDQEISSEARESITDDEGRKECEFLKSAIYYHYEKEWIDIIMDFGKAKASGETRTSTIVRKLMDRANQYLYSHMGRMIRIEGISNWYGIEESNDVAGWIDHVGGDGTAKYICDMCFGNINNSPS